jgi:hypothetical protein
MRASRSLERYSCIAEKPLEIKSSHTFACAHLLPAICRQEDRSLESFHRRLDRPNPTRSADPASHQAQPAEREKAGTVNPFPLHPLQLRLAYPRGENSLCCANFSLRFQH